MYNYRDHAARDEAIRRRCRVTCRNNDKNGRRAEKLSKTLWK